MSTYRYQPGDRPLEGYTVRAPAGRGGFGEVYFAESDAGREVALKALYVNQGHDEIELRGIRHCMNLKSPHLVSIFDVKTGDDGTPFVVMEYVAGPSLRDLLNDSPQGLGPDKAAFFLREVAKGLSHLHGYGVVHRDLKPANIFYEDGYVKIGDYGLSKLMTADPVASQTVTVGTVHYMAPEVGVGKYDKSIDLYALGCLLYEMLTGKVPYSGASPSEVLMKHLQAEPELDEVPDTFARVIRKALQKDPADRYASATEMVEDLFGAEHVRNSVSQLNADELSVIAQRVGKRVAPPLSDTTPPAQTESQAVPSDPVGPAALLVDATRRWPQYTGRLFMALTTALAAVAGIITALGSRDPGGSFVASLYLLLTVGPATAWAISQGRPLDGDSPLGDRLRAAVLAVIAHLLVTTLVIFSMAIGGVSARAGQPMIWAAFISMVVVACVYWPRHMHPRRTVPFSPWLWISLGCAAALPTLIFVPQIVATAFVLPVIVALGVQLLSPVTSAASPSNPPTPDKAPRPAVTEPDAPVAGAAAAAAPAPIVAHAGPSPVQPNSSRHSRLAAILLCAVWIVIPLGGLHRFYAGRWFTGILWLCTFGFLGIGQLVDAILILCGAFTDSQDKPLTRWELTNRSQARIQSTSASKNSDLQRTWTPRIDGRTNPFAMLLHLLGILLLLISLALVIPVFLSIPQAIAILPTFDSLRVDIAQEVGYDAWPQLLGRLMGIVGLGGIVIATLMIVVGRRGGVLHSLRALIAGGILFVFAGTTINNNRARVASDYALQNIQASLTEQGQTSFVAALDLYLDHANPGVFGALVILGLAMTLLAIPARSRPAPTTQGLEASS